MKKLAILLFAFIFFGAAQNAVAYTIEVGDYLNLESYNSDTSAGEFTFAIVGSGDTIDTFCLEPTVYINLTDNYLVTAIEAGTGSATANSDAWNQIAYLYSVMSG